jgi:hypothetical protein
MFANGTIIALSHCMDGRIGLVAATVFVLASCKGDLTGGTPHGGAGATANGGTAGTSADGGAAGAGANSGAAGGIPNTCDICPDCPTDPPADLVEACVLDAGGVPLALSVTSSVRVVSVGQVPGGNCRQIDGATSGGPTMRLVLESPTSQRWTMFLRTPDLPAALVSANDTLDLSVSVTEDVGQIITLSRSEQLLAIALTGSEFRGFQGLFGLRLGDEGPVCRQVSCGKVAHATRVDYAGSFGPLIAGETRQLEDLSFTVEENSRATGGAGCGATGRFSMAGFVPWRPACTDGRQNSVEACALLEDGSVLKTSVTTGVTVVSVDDVPGGNCRDLDYVDSGGPTRRMVLQAADGQRWTVFLRVPGLPQSLVSVNEMLDLTVTVAPGGWVTPAGMEQTIVLSRAGQLLAFGFSGGAGLPKLEGFGIGVTDAGSSCRPAACSYEAHRTHVTAGSSEATIEQGATVQISDISFTVEANSRWHAGGACDAPYLAYMGGYAVR